MLDLNIRQSALLGEEPAISEGDALASMLSGKPAANYIQHLSDTRIRLCRDFPQQVVFKFVARA